MLICFSSRKGGCGKSTLLCSMAGLLASMGYEVLVIDYDPQGTAAFWSESRTEIVDVPMVYVASARNDSDLERTLAKHEGQYDFFLIDLPGVDSNDNREKLVHAHKVIIPFKPTQADLNTLAYVKKMNEKLIAANPKVQIYFVLNEVPTTTKRSSSSARRYFEHFGVPLLDVDIHQRQVFRDSITAGLSVCEMSNEKASDEVYRFVAEVLDVSVAEIRTLVRDNSIHKRSNVTQNSDNVTSISDNVIQG